MIVTYGIGNEFFFVIAQTIYHYHIFRWDIWKKQCCQMKNCKKMKKTHCRQIVECWLFWKSDENCHFLQLEWKISPLAFFPKNMLRWQHWLSYFCCMISWVSESSQWIVFLCTVLILHSKLKNCVERPCIIKGWLWKECISSMKTEEAVVHPKKCTFDFYQHKPNPNPKTYYMYLLHIPLKITSEVPTITPM